MIGTLLGYLNSAAAIAVVLGLCLMFHETGHFLVAKAFRMKVEEFAFGFGPSLLRFRRGETLYRFNIFFFIGAYVKIAGMEPGAEYVDRGFHSKPRWQGALVIIAGSVANIILATIIFTTVTLWTGMPDPNDLGIYVSKTATGSPAAQAGVQAADQIVAVDGQRFSLDIAEVAPQSPAAKAGLRKGLVLDKVGEQDVYTTGELLAALRAAKAPTVRVEAIDYEAKDLGGQLRTLTLPALPPAAAAKSGAKAEPAPETLLSKQLGLRFEPLHQGALVGYINLRPAQAVTLTVARGGQLVQVPMTTLSVYGRKEGRTDKGMLYSRIVKIGRIGVVLRSATRPAGFGESLRVGAIRTYGAAATVIISIQAMINKQIEPELSGPVAIMAISAERARIGWDAVLNWCGIISSILAVMNLFPFPPFDGFKAVLLGLEGIMRRRIPAKLETVVSLAGFAVVILLGVVLIFKDSVNQIMYHTQ